MTEQEQIDTNIALVKAIAAQLGGHAEFADELRWCFRSTIKLANGHRFTISDSQQTGKLSIRGSYPLHANGHYVYDNDLNPPAIGVSSARTPEAIAKDISRRFLPNYKKVYALVRIRIDRETIRQDLGQQARAKLIAAFPGARQSQPDAERVYCSGSTTIDSFPSSDGTVSVTVKTSVSLETALKIGAVLTEHASE